MVAEEVFETPSEQRPQVNTASVAPALVAESVSANDEISFLAGAFPPMLPGNEAHSGAWLRDDCILCHETGVAGAPLIRHEGMSELLKQAKCRTCHVAPDPDAAPLTNLLGTEVTVFNADAFPPTMPNDESHSDPWTRQDCLLCHKWGVGGARKIRHAGLPDLLLQAKCRTCHLPSANANGL